MSAPGRAAEPNGDRSNNDALAAGRVVRLRLKVPALPAIIPAAAIATATGSATNIQRRDEVEAGSSDVNVS